MTDDTKRKPCTSNEVVFTSSAAKLETNPMGEATCQVHGNPTGDRSVTSRTNYNPPTLTKEMIRVVDGVKAELTWEHAENQVVFEVSWWTDETDRKVDYTNSRNYMITKLKAGCTYSVKVTCVTDTHEYSSVASQTVHFDTAPVAPTDIRFEIPDFSPHNSIIVYFNDRNETREVTHEVLVESITDNPQEIRKTTTNRKMFIGGLIPGVSYSVSVVAKDKRDGNLKSQPAYYEYPIMTHPAIPGEVELIEHEDDKVTFSWQALEIKPSHYEVQWEANGVKSIAKVHEETFTLDELKLSTIYKFRVAAVNKAGRSYLSEEKSYQTAPMAPVNVTVQKNKSSPTSSFIVKYEDPDPLKKRYEAFATSLDGRIVSTARSESHDAVLNNLPAGLPHYIYVTAFYGDSESEKAYCTQSEN